jgi:hypothetical protein
MNLIAKTFGAMILQLLILAAAILVVALNLWWLVPAAFPAADISFGEALALAGLLYLGKAIYAVK